MLFLSNIGRNNKHRNTSQNSLLLNSISAEHPTWPLTPMTRALFSPLNPDKLLNHCILLYNWANTVVPADNAFNSVCRSNQTSEMPEMFQSHLSWKENIPLKIRLVHFQPMVPPQRRWSAFAEILLLLIGSKGQACRTRGKTCLRLKRGKQPQSSQSALNEKRGVVQFSNQALLLHIAACFLTWHL